MMQLQAVALSCVSQAAAIRLKSFFEDTLNCYRYKVIELPAVIITIYNEGERREGVFHDLDKIFSTSPDAKLIIISEPDLSGMERLDVYDKAKDPYHQHELFLRHTVSILRTRYKSWPVEVYVPDLTATTFRKIL